MLVAFKSLDYVCKRSRKNLQGRFVLCAAGMGCSSAGFFIRYNLKAEYIFFFRALKINRMFNALTAR